MRAQSDSLILISVYHLVCGAGSLALMCLAGLVVATFGAGTFMASDRAAAGGSALVALAVLFAVGLFLVLGIANLVVGWGLFQRREWARLGAMILAVFRLPNLPFGTAAGALILLYLLGEEGRAQFAG